MISGQERLVRGRVLDVKNRGSTIHTYDLGVVNDALSRLPIVHAQDSMK